jgi:hypothetical protein
MSIHVDYFFNHEDDLAAVARKANTWIGCSLAPYEGRANDLFCRFLGMELSLSTHTFENDRDLDFENYTYCLSSRTPIPDWDLRITQVPAMAFIAYALYFRMNLKGMLVYDVQHLLARYEDRLDLKGSGTETMFDAVSGEFVLFPRHLIALDSRLQKVLYQAQQQA